MRSILVGLVIAGLMISGSGVVAQQRPQISPLPPSASKALTGDDIRKLLPDGKLQVDVMNMQFSPRLPELSRKLRAGMQAHPDWFRAHQEEFKRPNHHLPYDPNLGLTKSEYAEFTAIVDKGPKMIKVADGVIVVKSNGATISLEGQAELSFLTGVRIDLAANQVTTPYGVLKTVERVKPNARQPGGKWEGIMWKYETRPSLPASSPPTDAAVVSLTVGKYLSGKRGQLMYVATKVTQGQPVINNVMMLDFEIANAK